MSSKKSPLAQSRIELKRLKAANLYKGDLRKISSRAAKTALKKYADVAKGLAVAVQPHDPKRFKNIFKVVGKTVIVPKRKGEKITIDKKTKEIVSKRKVGKRTVVARGMQIKRGQTPPKRTYSPNYAVPLKSKGGGVDWFRFPDRDELIKFMSQYDFLGWEDYVVEERIYENGEGELDDEELNERLDNKSPDGRIKGNVKWTREERAQIRKDYRELIAWKKKRKAK